MKDVSHLFISGRVQGVGFRYFVSHAASVYGVNGFARNLLNGGVEVYAEGEEKDLREFVRKVSTGPRQALVTKVSESKIPIISAVFKSFEILEDE